MCQFTFSYLPDAQIQLLLLLLCYRQPPHPLFWFGQGRDQSLVILFNVHPHLQADSFPGLSPFKDIDCSNWIISLQRYWLYQKARLLPSNRFIFILVYIYLSFTSMIFRVYHACLLHFQLLFPCIFLSTGALMWQVVAQPSLAISQLQKSSRLLVNSLMRHLVYRLG